VATATPPTPGETIATPEPTPADVSNGSTRSNALAAEAPALTPPASAATPQPTATAEPPLTPVARPGDAQDLVPTQKSQKLMERVQEFRARHEKWEMAAFFLVGFLYDVLTLSRVDDTLTMVQQFAYLGVLASLLMLEQRYPVGTEPPKVLAKVWRWREDAIHFFYGSLLSTFMLFFFKSASGIVAVLFLSSIFALLVANELPRFRQLGPVIRVALFSMCLSMYLSYVLPVVIGRLNFWIFLLAQVLAGGVVYGMMRLLLRWKLLDMKAAIRQIAVPGFGVLVALLLLYVAKVIPPVPLAVTFSGIYHQVKRVDGVPGGTEYHLSHERSWWRFWHKGDQYFRVRPGDKVNYFVSVFAPKGFSRFRVFVTWYYDDPRKGWRQYHRMPLPARSTGAEVGYRTYANLTNPPEGDWTAVLETEDGHEINQLSFTVEKDERTEERQFQVFVHQHASAQNKAAEPQKAAPAPEAKPAPAPAPTVAPTAPASATP